MGLRSPSASPESSGFIPRLMIIANQLQACMLRHRACCRLVATHLQTVVPLP